jgi:4-hydroxybenzoate polyprenyltransferase
MKKLLDWFLLTSSLTAFCAMGLCMATERLINDIPIPWFNQLDLLVFGCTLIIYNLHKAVIKRHSVEVGLPKLTAHHRLVYTLMSFIGFFIASIGFRAVLSEQMLVAFATLGLISFAYSLPLLPFKTKRRLRDYGWLKILSLASVWTIVTSVLPMIYWQRHISDHPFEIIVRFLFIFTLCILFDIRDVKDDSASKINTFPQMVGIGNSYWVINISLILFIAAGIAQYLQYPVWERLLAVVITAILTRIVAEYLKTHNSERNYLVYADGVMIVYSLLVLLL